VPVTHDIDQAVNLAERVLAFASLPERRTVDALIRPERS
jgi:ABC-type nitrate/sulfonate/bicarbonate transport system ATPase subunit